MRIHTAGTGQRLYLDAATAADLMTPNPVSIRASAPLKDAVVLLTDKGYSAAPVIDDAGQAIGVISRTDILMHDRESSAALAAPEYYQTSDLDTRRSGTTSFERAQRSQRACVRDVMTPVVFSVSRHLPAARVVEEMLALNVHRLFVVDDGDVLVGVISMRDVLRHLQPEDG